MDELETTIHHHPVINNLNIILMKELTKDEYISITGGGDLFLYDLFYMLGTVYEACREAGETARSTPGTNSYTQGLKMGGL